MISQFCLAQTYDKEDLYNFVDLQDKKQILEILKKDGFKYKGGPSGLVVYAKSPKENYVVESSEIEALGFGTQNGMYMIQYMPKPDNYSTYKVNLLQDNYTFVMKKKKEEVYKNNKYIIAFKDKESMILIMTELNNVE